MTPWAQSYRVNGVLAAVALTLALLAMGRNPQLGERQPVPQSVDTELSFGTLPDGTRALQDADGMPAALKHYQRIASGSLLSDRVLIEICDPRRIVTFTTYAAQSPVDGHRFAAKPHVAALDDIEGLMALNPDLVLLNTHTSLAKIERLREAGMTVFNLGQMRGLETLNLDVRQIATLIGQPERGERFLETFHQRIDRIAQTLRTSARNRKTALYLTVLGKILYGGGAHTSHHDVLSKAGLIDVAAPHYEGWPRLSTVELLRMNPELIVLRDGAGQVLCELPGTEGLRACANGRSGIIEGPQALWAAPGPGMLPAAEYLYRQVYGTREATATDEP